MTELERIAQRQHSLALALTQTPETEAALAATVGMRRAILLDIPALLAVVRAAVEWDRWLNQQPSTEGEMDATWLTGRLHNALAALLEEVRDADT